MSMCKVVSCIVGKGSLLWPVYSLGKTLLAFVLLHFVLQGQTCLLLQVSLDFLLLNSSPLWWKGYMDAYVFLNYSFVSIYSQEWDGWIKMVILFLVFFGNSILFCIVAVAAYIPTNTVQGFSFFHILSIFFIYRFFNDGLSDQCKVYCSFNLIFLIITSVKHLFMCLLTICMCG